MKLALGLKAHSGWAALIALGTRGTEILVVDRRRIELVESREPWANQPYHAAEDLPPAQARAVVQRGIDAARRCAVHELRAAIGRAESAGHEVAACAVVVGAPMPEWSVDEIIAVHFRMHKAEGILYRDALLDAAGACGLRAVAVPDKDLGDRSAVASLGKTIGPPWGSDQKDAALAALAALKTRAR